MKYTSTILAAAAITNAAPAQPVCNVIVQIVTGSGVWVPNAQQTTWAAWSSSSSSPAVKTSSSVDPTWAAWSSSTSSTPAVKTSTSADPTSWYAWGPSSAPSSSISATTTTSVSWTKPATTSKVETTTISKGGEFYPTTSKSATTTSKVETTTTTAAPTTTTAATTTSSITTTTTTTTEAPKATATCPASNGSAFQASGSCECSYNINCGVKTTPGAGTSFWERHSGELIDTLDECIAICDENSSCTAVLYVDQEGASAQDYKHCWQTSGLPQPDGTGYAKISYKGACSGSCSAGYSAPQ